MSAHMLHLFDLNGQPLPFNAVLDTPRKLWVHLMEKPMDTVIFLNWAYNDAHSNEQKTGILGTLKYLEPLKSVTRQCIVAGSFGAWLVLVHYTNGRWDQGFGSPREYLDTVLHVFGFSWCGRLYYFPVRSGHLGASLQREGTELGLRQCLVWSTK